MKTGNEFSVKTWLIFVACTFFSSFPAHAFLHEASPPCKLNNALTKCSANIQKSLKKYDAGRWGQIQFDCENGFLKTIQTSTSAPLASSWKDFVLGNPGYFGLQSKDLRLGNMSFEQTWHALPIDYTSIDGNSPYDSNHTGEPGSVFHLHANLVNTHAWHLNTVPAVSSTSAALAALKIWQEGAPNTAKEVSSVDLEIYIRGPASCGTAKDPRLIWMVVGHDNVAAGAFWCMIDAQTGTPCDPKYCLENSEAKSL